MPEKECAHCGASIVQAKQGRRRVYCSRSCLVAATKARPSRQCAGCGRPYRTMGRQCGACSSKASRRSQGLPTRDQFTARSCDWCGEQFQPKLAKQRYCCSRHGWLARSRDNSTGRPPGQRYERERFCQHCGTSVGISSAARISCDDCKAATILRNNRRKGRPPRGTHRQIERSCTVCERSFSTTAGSRRQACSEHRALAKYLGQSEPIPWAKCPGCDTWFIQRGRRACSRSCAKTHYNRTLRTRPAPAEKKCPSCGGESDRPLKKCRACRVVANRNQRAREGDKKRAKLYGAAYEPINRRRVYDRDNWTCGICGDPIDPKAKWPDIWCASLDHITPMSKGGSHTYANVQAAHHWCNSVKGTDETLDLKVA